MHVSEFGLLFALALMLLTIWVPRSLRKNQRKYVAAAAALVVVLFLAWRITDVGLSWQLYPALALFCLLVLAMIFSARVTNIWRWLCATILTFLWAVSLLPLLLFPIPALPEPSGAYGVGTISLHLTDDSRTEIYGRNAGEAREFMVQVWYPADATEGYPRAQYLPNAESSAPAIANRLELPSFILDHTQLIQVNSLIGAPVSNRQASYPLLVFSHGYQSLRGQTTPLMEALASHGYVVAAMEHTFGAAVTIFPEGRIEYLDPTTLSGEGAAYDASARKLGNQWQEDIEYFLNEVSLWQPSRSNENPLVGRLNMDKLAMFGHSTGAGVVTKTCLSLECQAVLGLDAWFGPMPDAALKVGARQPTLFLMSEIWPKPKNSRRIAEFMQNSSSTAWWTILGTGHYDFSDIPLLSPLTFQLGLSGPIDSERGQRIVIDTTIAFFEHTLSDAKNRPFQKDALGFDELLVEEPEALLKR